MMKLDDRKKREAQNNPRILWIWVVALLLVAPTTSVLAHPHYQHEAPRGFFSNSVVPATRKGPSSTSWQKVCRGRPIVPNAVTETTTTTRRQGGARQSPWSFSLLLFSRGGGGGRQNDEKLQPRLLVETALVTSVVWTAVWYMVPRTFSTDIALFWRTFWWVAGGWNASLAILGTVRPSVFGDLLNRASAGAVFAAGVVYGSVPYLAQQTSSSILAGVILVCAALKACIFPFLYQAGALHLNNVATGRSLFLGSIALGDAVFARYFCHYVVTAL